MTSTQNESSTDTPPESGGDPGFDLLVLGAGSGGYACALRAAQLGFDVGLVERDRVGGTCLHRGCIPTKAILHAAEIADNARDAARFGVQASLDGVDLAQVRAYSDSVVNRLYKGLSGLIRSRSITVIEGEGRLIPGEVAGQPGDVPAIQVGERTYRAPHIVLATGSYSRTVPGLELGERILTSEQALRLDRLPRSAIVLGGGVIGVEFASAWRSFGVEVTILEALPRLLPPEDPAISAALERALRKRGITIRTGATMAGISSNDDGVQLTTETGEQLSAELLLVAVGRGPASDGFGFEESGVALNRGYVETDDRLRTSVPGVRAVGDLVFGLQLAHRGFAHGIFVAEDIAHQVGRDVEAPTPVLDTGIPRVAYSHPEIASVGMSETQAREAYGDAETLTYDLGGNGKSQILKTQGFVKLVRRPNGPVVGVHLIGDRVGELIAEAQLITNWEAYPDEVATLLHPHPTQSEALGEAHLALAGKPLHSHA